MKLGRAPATTRTFIEVRERDGSTMGNVVGALARRFAALVPLHVPPA